MKLLIVSSYHRHCGIAQYVEHLEVALRAQGQVDIEIAPVPVDLLKLGGRIARAMAKAELDQMLDKVRQADVVSLQLEPGLFGANQLSRWSVIRRILASSRKAIITYHTAPAVLSPVRPTIRGLKQYLREIRSEYVFQKLFGIVRRNQRKFLHIVQTKREVDRLALLGVASDRVFDMPLSFIGRQEKLVLTKELQRPATDTRYDVENKILIGFFGFLTPHKGVEIVVKALSILPSQFHLLIVGGTHPDAVRLHEVSQPYISKLAAMLEESSDARRIANSPLTERVTFCGALDNAGFNEVMASCDAIVLPYAEVGQTSSGPAAIALDLGKPLYCTRTACFTELAGYAQGALSLFEIGNHIELAQMIRRNDAGSEVKEGARNRYRDLYNVERRASLYLDLSRRLEAEAA